MIYALIILQFLDAISTYLVIKTGAGREGNKWISIAIDRMGLIPALALIKGAAIVLIYFWGNTLHEHALALLGIFYVWVSLNNFTILRKK